MKTQFKAAAADAVSADAIILPVYEGESLGRVGKRVDRANGGLLSAIVGSDFKGGRDEIFVQRLSEGSAPRAVLMGLGSKDSSDAESLRRAAGSAVQRLRGVVKSAVVAVDDLSIKVKDASGSAQAIAEGGGLASYVFDRFRDASSQKKLQRLTLASDRKVVAEALKAGTLFGSIVVDANATARDLGNLPGNHGQPTVLAAEARRLGRKHGFKVTAMGPKELEKRDMGALLSVAKGSPVEPRLIVMDYNPGGPGLPTVALVGKGLTFDSGGISIKPSANMDKMRYDKCGGCAVIGAMHGVAAAKLPLRVIGIVPASENMPGGDPNKPGDVVTASNGKTIEVLNTDAEGRLILADALVHAQSFKPDVTIDLATLTGACMVALGQHCAGLMTRSDDLARDLVRAGNSSFERVWRLPLWDEYVSEMKGSTTDLKNLGGPYGGASTAGAFLESFAPTGKWAHVDIAPVAWDDPSRPYAKGSGATGFGVRLLLEYLRGLGN